MDDPLNLAEIYIKNRIESVRYLELAYGAITVETENLIEYPVTLNISITVEDNDINLLISLPFNFPDSFPRVKLDDQSFQKLYPLPHLNIFKTLCIFDEVVASPNPENPKGVLDATIEKSREILIKGILKLNLEDYIDEFETYWAEESKGIYLSIVEPSEILKEVCLVPFKYGKWLEKGIFCDQKSEAIKWIQNLGGTFNEKEIFHVLYVPLLEPMKFPFPKYNKDIFHLLKNNKSNIKDYSHFLSKHKRPTKILFSNHLNNEYTWGVWEHLKPYKRKSVV